MNDWIDRYKVVRRLSLVWIGWLITHATFAIFSDIGSINAAAATAYATVTGLLGLIWGKYFHDRHKEDEQTKKK